ncbi:MAG TPA: hypothetical protein VNE17_05420 [Nitrolancea sp.]|nr:hypothetical protein [Nitrolancea sp.]
MSASNDAASQIDPKQLRASLRLCFNPEQADSLAALMRRDDDSARSLAPVLRSARVIFNLRRSVAPLFGRRAEAPLRPRLGLAAEPALALAVHLGLGFDSQFLGKLFNKTIVEIGASLQQARHFVEIERTLPCVEFAPAIGRYRDLWAERSEQIALLQHVSQCEDCRHALDIARETDARLLAIVETSVARLPAPRPSPRRLVSWLIHPAVYWTGLSLVVIALIAGLVFGTSRLLTGPSHAAPLVAASTTTLPAGWLLEADGAGAVDAVEVRSGQRRVLVPGESGSRVNDLISPDHRTIAQVIYLQYPEQPESLRIYSLDGTLRERWDLETASYVRTPIAWVDSSRLLMSQLPVSAYEPTLNVYTNNQRQVSSLVVLNVVTGAEQAIAEQGVHLALPSPDGKFIAIERYTNQPSDSLEIRPFDGGKLGSPVATFDDQPAGFWWAPDSSHLFAAIRKATDVTASPTSENSAHAAGEAFAIARIDHTGQVQKLVDLGVNDFVNLLGLSPDGGTMIYTRGSGAPGTGPWGFWLVDTSSGQSIKLTDGNPQLPSAAQVAWAPDDSAFVVTNAEPYYLAPSSTAGAPSGSLSYVTLAFDRHGRSFGAVLDEFTPRTWLGWMPNDTLPATMPVQSATSGHAAPATSTNSVAPNLAINAFSQLSPDGSRLLLFSPALDTFVDQQLDGSAPQTMSGDATDPSWLPDGSGTIGVRLPRVGNQVGSRLVLSGSSSAAEQETLTFDPANVGQSTDADYHLPLISPNGLRYSFFLVRGGAMELWVGGRDQVAQSVATWIIPDGAKVDVPLLARWVGNNDLIYVVADNWSRGLPQRVVLQRWSGSPTGSGSVAALLNWSTRGSEQGVLGQELTLSTDGTRLAIRLRHYTDSDFAKDRYDSIEVAASNDVSQAFEIVRDSPGDGLSWSPNGSELVAGLRGKIAVLAADGRTIEYPSIGTEAATYPIWIQPNEIWFSAQDGSRQTIQRLTR